MSTSRRIWDGLTRVVEFICHKPFNFLILAHSLSVPPYRRFGASLLVSPFLYGSVIQWSFFAHFSKFSDP
jgi:hypothetical protein